MTRSRSTWTGPLSSAFGSSGSSHSPYERHEYFRTTIRHVGTTSPSSFRRRTCRLVGNSAGRPIARHAGGAHHGEVERRRATSRPDSTHDQHCRQEHHRVNRPGHPPLEAACRPEDSRFHTGLVHSPLRWQLNVGAYSGIRIRSTKWLIRA